MTMSHLQIVLLCIGGKLVLGKRAGVQSPCEAALCQAGCKPIWCWCSRDTVMDRRTQYHFHFHQRAEAGQRGLLQGLDLSLSVVLVQNGVRRSEGVLEQKSKRGEKEEEEEVERWYDSDVPGWFLSAGIFSSAHFCFVLVSDSFQHIHLHASSLCDDWQLLSLHFSIFLLNVTFQLESKPVHRCLCVKCARS